MMVRRVGRRRGGNEKGVEEEGDFAADGDVRVVEGVAEDVPAVCGVELSDGCGAVPKQARESIDRL